MLEQTTPQLAPKERCTGCGACANGCPRGAIHMLPDREGFLYPTVTDACIQCGHCSHICPVRKQREPRPEPRSLPRGTRTKPCAARPPRAAYSPRSRTIFSNPAASCSARPRTSSSMCGTSPSTAPRSCRACAGRSPCRVRSATAIRRCATISTAAARSLFRHALSGRRPLPLPRRAPENLLTCDVLCSGAASPGVWAHLLQTMAYIKQHEPLSVQFFGKLPGRAGAPLPRRLSGRRRLRRADRALGLRAGAAARAVPAPGVPRLSVCHGRPPRAT